MDGLRNAISQGPGLVIFRALIFFLLAYVLYTLYIWLSGGDTDLKDYILYSSPNLGLPANGTVATYTSANVPMIYEGGEFSVSTWIYVNSWTTTGNKLFFTLSTGAATSGYPTLALYLGKTRSKLGIRLSRESTPSAITLNTTSIVAGTASPYMDSNFENCDIEEVALQKWVSITVAVSGKTVDVYIDGKLSRSCVLEGIYRTDGGNTPTVNLGGTSGFGGYIGQTRVSNFAYSPDQVYRNYLSGPFDNSIWALLMSQLNPAQYSFNIQRNGQTVVGGSI